VEASSATAALASLPGAVIFIYIHIYIYRTGPQRAEPANLFHA
jgi:hypothetical protein